MEWPCVWVIYTWLQEKASTEETKQHSSEVQHGNHYNTAPSLLEHSDNWLKFQCGWAWLKSWIKRQIVIHIYGYNTNGIYTYSHVYIFCMLLDFFRFINVKHYPPRLAIAIRGIVLPFYCNYDKIMTNKLCELHQFKQFYI